MSQDKNNTSNVPTPPPAPVAPAPAPAPVAPAPASAAPVAPVAPAPAPAPVAGQVSGSYEQPSGFAPMQTGYMETPSMQPGFPAAQGAPVQPNQAYQQPAPAYQQPAQPYQQPGSQANMVPSNYGQPAAPQYQNAAAPGIVPKDSNLTLAAFILCIVSCVFYGWLIVPLAWMIPMTVYAWKIHKCQGRNTVAFGVCTLIFTSLIAGILLLVSPKDE